MLCKAIGYAAAAHVTHTGFNRESLEDIGKSCKRPENEGKSRITPAVAYQLWLRLYLQKRKDEDKVVPPDHDQCRIYGGNNDELYEAIRVGMAKLGAFAVANRKMAGDRVAPLRARHGEATRRGSDNHTGEATRRG